MTSTTGEAQDLDVTDSGLLSDPGGQGGQVYSHTPPLPEAMEQQALTTCPSRESPALEELNHIHVDIPDQLPPSVSHTMEEAVGAIASSSTSSSSSLDNSKTQDNFPNTGATASTLASNMPVQTAPSSSPSPSPPNPTPPTCSSCGLSSSPTTSSTASSTNASSSSSSPASSSGVSLSSSSSPPAELLPTGGNCSPVDSGTSSCLTLVQEEVDTFSRAALEEGVGDGASTATLSRSSCGSSTSGSNTSVGSSCSEASNSSVEFELQQPGHEQLNAISVPEEDSSGSTTSSTSTAPGAKHHSQEVNGSLNTGAPTEPNSDHVHATGGRSPTQEQQGASGHYAPAQEAVSDSSSAQLAQQGAGLQPPHNTYHQGIPASSPHLQGIPNSSPHPHPNHRHTPPPPDTPPPPPPPSSQKTQQQPPPPPLPPRNGIGRGAGVSSRAAPTGVTGPPGVVDVCGRCGGRRVQDTCGDRLLTATSDFSPLTDDTSALLAADELARTCSLQTQEEEQHPQQRLQRPPVSSSAVNGCGCAGRVWGGVGGVVGGDHHHHHHHHQQACTGGVGGGGGAGGGGGGSSGSGRRALPPVTRQSHVVPSRAGIQIQNGLQEGNTSAAKTNTSNAHPDSSTSSRNVINYHISLDKTHLDIADSPTFITDKTTSFIDNITTSNSGSSDGGNTTGASGALKGKNQETKTKKSYKDSLIKRYKAYKTAKIEQKQQEQKGRRASIETIMEFDENFHGNDDDDGLDSPMSDCTSLFSLGSDAEACLQEVMEGLGEDYCLTGGGGASSGDSSPVHGEGRSLRWDKGRRKVRRPRSLTKADYQAVRQQCEGSSNGSALDPGGSNNNNNNGRARFVVQVDGQRLTPEEVADSVVSLPGKSGPRMAESSFMEMDNIPSVSQPSTPCMPDIGPALPGGAQAQRLENKHKSNSLEGGSDQAGRYPSKHNTSTFVQSPNGNTTPLIGSSSRASPEVSTSNSSTAAARALSAQGGAVNVQRPDVLNLNLTSPNSDPGAADRGGIAGLPTSPSQPTGALQDPTGTQQQQAPYLLTPGGHRCCTCGQTIPNPGGNPADNANNGDSLNGNLIHNTHNDRSVSTVVDVHVNASNHDDPGGKDGPCDVTDVAVPPPVPSRSQTMTPMTPSQRFAYIEALQKEKQRSSIKGQSLAPPLHDNLRYHAFFLYHNNDRDWVLNVMEKLESPTLGFKCCCHERDLDCSLSLPQAVLYGMKNSVKTVVVLSPDFVSSTWSSCEVVVSELDGGTLQRDLLLVMLQDCDLPHLVTDLPYIDASKRDWWTKLLATLALPDDTPMTEETVLSMSSSLVGLNPGLQSGHLLHSIKSKCLCCGRELVDPTEVPDELIAHGVQIPPEEYCQAIRQLMCETKFRCHIWCYNMPVAMVFFTLFLGLCLAIIPVIETKYMFSGTDLTHPSLPTPASKGVSVQPSKKQTGLEYVHGAVVWLCVLTLYMLCTHLARRKMKDKTYRRLSEVNTVFIKYNLLVGVENLGLADCNKYYLHFFYFELGPCLAYLQELVDNLEDVSPCYTNQAYLQELLVNLEECTPCYSNQVLENDAHLEDGEDAEGLSQEASASDRMNVLDQNNITNVSMQTHAEDLLLDHSGEYINMLITKKLDRPRKQRHVKGAYCLCQFVEQRVYKMVV